MHSVKFAQHKTPSVLFSKEDWLETASLEFKGAHFDMWDAPARTLVSVFDSLTLPPTAFKTKASA